ncbi:MAG: hypothetical protein CMN05_00240 [Roseibacillus sp.]|jgi:hypothetical protein|nr:hypothetical protein [Roseibacillus sp.]MBP35062.1 hypothetical protein [Roseibacillus sp.]MCP4731344.1 hypothetical protein [Roseibacillus sp.]MDP6206804.1 hypothetical protein [Roseibacillus sp.]MDP7107475.1 hypothetical protein [Roseibacillus sp.]|tara:strand:- start:8355 stop:8813 length:459 start_codon:yes stop_codon:yes gene_type:complete
MKKESFHKLITLVAAVGLLGVAPHARSGEDTKEPEAKDMEEAMDLMSGSLKRLRRLRRDPDRWTKSAALVAEGSQIVIASMKWIPKEIEELPEGPEKIRALADSRRLMGLTLAGYAELELAFLAQDEEKAEETLDKLKEIKAESHEKYNKGE